MISSLGAIYAIGIFLPFYGAYLILLLFISGIMAIIPSWRHLVPRVWFISLGSFIGAFISTSITVLLALAVTFLPIPEWIYVWHVSSNPEVIDFMIKPFIILFLGVIGGTVAGALKAKKETK